MNLSISFHLSLNRWKRAGGSHPDARFWHVYVSLWVCGWRAFVERGRSRDLCNSNTEWYAGIGRPRRCEPEPQPAL